MADPATNMSAPASAISFMLATPQPPSTCWIFKVIFNVACVCVIYATTAPFAVGKESAAVSKWFVPTGYFSWIGDFS